MTLNHPWEIHAAFQHAFNAGDVTSLLELYEPDAMLAVGPAESVTGLEAIRGVLTPPANAGMTMTLRTVFVMERGDLALLSGEWTLAGVGEPRSGKSSEVARRGADGRWRYIIDNPWSA